MRPVIFLDIDGVLTTEKAQRRMGSQTYLHPAQVDFLNEIVRATRAFTIISSTWRFDSNVRSLLSKAGFTGDYHPARWSTGPVGQCRGEEIADTIEALGITNFVILDDDPSILPPHRARHVKTRVDIGLTPSHVSFAIEVLLGLNPREP